MSAWAYAMPVWFHDDVQVIADTAAECAEGMCAVLAEFSGAPWRNLPAGGLTWEKVADIWGSDGSVLMLNKDGRIDHLAKPGIRVVPA